MTQDEIVKLAREAGYGWSLSDMHAPALERFANLVAAHTLSNIDPSTFMSCQEACEAARLAEREACAKVCEDKWVYTASASEMAEYIRARGKE